MSAYMFDVRRIRVDMTLCINSGAICTLDARACSVEIVDGASRGLDIIGCR